MRTGSRQFSGRSCRRRDVYSSSVFRLIGIVMAVLIPLNLLTLALGRGIISEAEEQISMETQHALQLYVGQIDDALARAADALNHLSVQSAHFRRLRDKAVTDDVERYRQVDAIVNLRRELKAKLEDNSFLAGMFAWFPEKDSFVQFVTLNYKAVGIQELAQTETAEEDTERYAHGALTFAGEEPVILLLREYRGAWVGAWIEVQKLADLVSGSDERLFAFSDRSGLVYCGSDGIPERLDLEAQHMLLHGAGHTLISAVSDSSDLCLVQLIPDSRISGALPAANRILQILSLLSLAILPIIMLAIQRWIAAPVAKLTDAMERIERGELDYRIEKGREGSEFDRINRSFNRMMDEVSALKISIYEEQLNAQKTKMAFLAQQIKPHFLLNTLNILYSYEQEDYPLIQKMLMLLSKYFRYVIRANQDFITLGREIEHVRNYFEIQQVRFEDSFHATVDCDTALENCLIPPLLIQTFAENAIKHALIPDECVEITVSARQRGEKRMVIRIEDTGAGISSEALERIEAFRRTRRYDPELGIGVQNSIDRVDLLYGGEGEVRIGNSSPQGAWVELALPVLTMEQQALPSLRKRPVSPLRGEQKEAIE